MPQSLNREASRDIDRRAIDEFGMSGLVLMENAGRGCAAWLADQRPTGSILILCGKGNNGGDGFVIARHLDLWGFDVSILLTCGGGELQGDAGSNFAIAQRSGLPLQEVAELSETQLVQAIQEANWCVDALLGTGAQGPPRPPLDLIINTLNQHANRVLAIDVPSGLDCETGHCHQPTVKATATCTFVAPKVGYFEPSAERVTGPLHVIDIGVPRRLLEELGLAPPQRGT